MMKLKLSKPASETEPLAVKTRTTCAVIPRGTLWARDVQTEMPGPGAPEPVLTLRISREMYAIQSSLSVFPLVFFTRSVMDPAPQNSITSCGRKHTQHGHPHTQESDSVCPPEDPGTCPFWRHSNY